MTIYTDMKSGNAGMWICLEVVVCCMQEEGGWLLVGRKGRWSRRVRPKRWRVMLWRNKEPLNDVGAKLPCSPEPITLPPQ